MPLVPAALAASLASDWLPDDAGGHADSAGQSGQRFAQAVSNWFGSATAGPFPCSTATARSSQLAASATAAFQAGQAPIAGTQLAMGLVAYVAGQLFGPGVASPPAGAAAAQAAITGVFADLDLPLSSRADQLAAATHALALTTIVVFPPIVSPPLPVT